MVSKTLVFLGDWHRYFSRDTQRELRAHDWLGQSKNPLGFLERSGARNEMAELSLRASHNGDWRDFCRGFLAIPR